MNKKECAWCGAEAEKSVKYHRIDTPGWERFEMPLCCTCYAEYKERFNDAYSRILTADPYVQVNHMLTLAILFIGIAEKPERIKQ